MRKRILFAFVSSLCMLDFAAFSAVERAATRQQSVSAGTKVAAATENTVIPKDCQNAFYGCMDSFCMLDNASGGRCQCSDRITELDQALDDIIKLDEQTYLMATEGVERIQLGEAESQVVSRANSTRDKVVSDDSSKRKKTRTIDLSAWNSVAFIDTDDMFDEFDSGESVSSFANKKGDALYKASATMCASQMSEQCKSYNSMLQLVYAQKVKSDCVAYENSLKVQKNQSQQKLQTAQKALRDAALEEYQNQNKYATLGDCVIAFTQCMQTTAECGTDYTGCVTLAARENVKNNKAGSRAKQKKIKGAIHGADITLAATTISQLTDKKVMCESVTKQCVNVNKNDAVWESFLRNAAPALKSAELIAEQNLRANCIPTLAECFNNACAAQFKDNDENYDACLSDPETYKSLCKVQLEPCLEATGGTYDNPTASSLWNTLVAFLNAMKVDACTAEVKACLEERCGEDYSECIGLDTVAVGNLCPYQKLTACMTANKDEETVRTYVAEIAAGLALQVDNALVAACQNAADEAMVRVCGDSETCEAGQFDLSSLAYMMKPMACRYNNASGTDRTCYPNVAQFGSSGNACGIFATLTGKPAISSIIYTDDGNFDSSSTSYFTPEFSADSTDQVVSILNGALNRIMTSIEADPKVQYCMYGRRVQGFYGFRDNRIDTSATRRNVQFTNLTKNLRAIVADYLLGILYEKNVELEEKFVDELDELNTKINERLESTKYSSGCGLGALVFQKLSLRNETKQDTANRNLCTCDRTKHGENETVDSSCLTATDQYRYRRQNGEWIKKKSVYEGSQRTIVDQIGTYDDNTNICTIQTIRYNCADWTSNDGGRCKKYGEGIVENTRIVQMPFASGSGNNSDSSSSSNSIVNSGKKKR